MFNKVLSVLIGFAAFAGLLCAILAASRISVVRWDGLFPYAIVLGLMLYYPITSIILPSGRTRRPSRARR